MKSESLRRWLWLVTALLAVAGVIIGVVRGEYEAVNRWGHTLCTSCIGLGK